MPWLQEDQRTSQPVVSLLLQITTIAQSCQNELATLLLERQRCQLNVPTDPLHAESARHGLDGTPRRDFAYASLQRAVAHLNQALQEVGLCRTEMSHTGGP
jgi:hypothetical protein